MILYSILFNFWTEYSFLNIGLKFIGVYREHLIPERGVKNLWNSSSLCKFSIYDLFFHPSELQGLKCIRQRELRRRYDISGVRISKKI